MTTPEQKPFTSLRNRPARALSMRPRATSDQHPPMTVARAAWFLGLTAVASAALFAAACAGKPAGSADTAEAAPPEGPVASGVNATVIVSKCPDAAHVNVRAAQDAIQKLVGPCASVPGGRAHFSATLQPSGTIVLASPEGDPAEGVVPTCVLQNRLSHRIRLKSPCSLDVQLDERTVTVERPDGGAPDASSSPAPKP